MGCWDVVCSLCALPLNSCSEECKKWMHKCTLLLNNNNIVFDIEEIACNTNFYDKKKKQNYTSLLYFPKSFIVVHTDCWKFCKKEYGLSLKYSDFPFHKISPNNFFVIDGVNYKPISNYWEQYFRIEEYLKAGYSLDSPLKNLFLAKFIKNIILQLKIYPEPRKSPRVSATYYKNNNLLIGNDGKIWEIWSPGRCNRWGKPFLITSRKLSIKIPVTKKNQKLLEDVCKYFSYAYFESKSPIIKKIAKLPQLGEVSSCGIILRDITTKIAHNNFTLGLTILYNELGKKEAEKLIESDFGLR
jgi:hypothetical protein